MRAINKAAAVTALAVSFLLPAAAVANATEPNHGTTTSTAAKAKTNHGETKSAEAKHKRHHKLVLAGTVTAVSPTSITFTVHGGRYKALRGTSVSAVVTATTKVSRNDADSAIASVKVGDHVNVKTIKTDAVTTTVGTVVTTTPAVFTAVRISASGL
ncbi:MAG: hypothetical protein ABI912_04265 [Actinomycetota bacterium]